MTKKILCIGRAINIFESSKMIDILKNEKKYEFNCVYDLEEAKKEIESKKYDAVILHGLRIPTKNEKKYTEKYTNPDWTKETKYAPGLGMIEYTFKKNIPIIAITNAPATVQAKAIKLGAKGIFKKTEKKRNIAEALENILK